MLKALSDIRNKSHIYIGSIALGMIFVDQSHGSTCVRYKIASRNWEDPP
jgi:hypothetical protein